VVLGLSRRQVLANPLEQRLLEFEREHLPGLDFFGASPERIRADVEKGLAFHNLRWTQRFVYRLALNKPSVSYSMIRLSALFVIGWVAFIVVFNLARKESNWLMERAKRVRSTHMTGERQIINFIV